MDKAHWRDRFKNIRTALSPEARQSEEAHVLEYLLPWVENGSFPSWMVYLPFGSELDTLPLIRHLLIRNRKVFAPRILDGHRLGSVPLAHLDQVSPNTWGIPEPIGPLMPSNFRADVIVVPGLGFDRHRQRVGYGKGYYDRFLALRPKLCFGVAFRCQVTDELPTEDHDIPLDAVVTADGLISPG